MQLLKFQISDEEEIAYAAYIPYKDNKKEPKMICFSFDIDVFFDYLKNLYSSYPELELVVKKFIVDKKFNFQSLYPHLEIIEIADKVYLTSWECTLWELYLRGLYQNSLDMLDKGKLNEQGFYWLETFDRFINYIGTEKLQKMINEGRFSYEAYELYLEFHRKIEDN